MSTPKLPLHPGLSATTRLRQLASDSIPAPLADWMLLAAFGGLAAISSACLDLQIRRVPGHAILRVVFPIAMGLALVPRRGAGTVMGGSALFTALLLKVSGIQGEGMGLGALTSLLCTGPFLDISLRRAYTGWRQYLGFALAGLASNTLALVIRGLAKFMHWEHAGRRPLGEWLAQASVTYLVCGIAAGLLSGLVLFYAARSSSDATADTPE